MTQHYLGWVAYRNSEWTFPLGLHNQLSYPNYISIINTDSLPIISLVFKSLSPILPEHFQFFGVYGLICFILQAVCAARILKHFTSNKCLVLISSIFFVIAPCFLLKMYAHTSLASHWIIIYSLELLFLHKLQNKKSIQIHIIIICLFSFPINAYFGLINGLIISFFCILSFLNDRKILYPCLYLSEYIIISLVIIYILGGFNNFSSFSSTDFTNANLNVLFNPHILFSYFINSLTVQPSNLKIGYLGIGILIIFAIDVTFILLNFFNKDVKNNLNFNKYERLVLLTLCALFYFISLAPIIAFNDITLWNYENQISKTIIIQFFQIFRSTCYLIYPVIYICMLACFITFYKIISDKSPFNKYAVFFIICILILQIIETHDFIKISNKEFNQIKTNFTISNLKNNDFWEKVGREKKIKHVVVFGFSNYNSNIFSYVYWTLKYKKDINAGCLSRNFVNQVNESIDLQLSNITDENIYIFLPAKVDNLIQFDKEQARIDLLNKYLPDSEYIIKNYKMNYYEIDGVIIGYKGQVDGFTPIKESDLKEKLQYITVKYIDANSADLVK